MKHEYSKKDSMFLYQQQFLTKLFPNRILIIISNKTKLLGLGLNIILVKFCRFLQSENNTT